MFHVNPHSIFLFAGCCKCLATKLPQIHRFLPLPYLTTNNALHVGCWLCWSVSPSAFAFAWAIPDIAVSQTGLESSTSSSPLKDFVMVKGVVQSLKASSTSSCSKHFREIWRVFFLQTDGLQWKHLFILFRNALFKLFNIRHKNLPSACMWEKSCL